MATSTRDGDREFQAYRAARGGLFEDFCRRSLGKHFREIGGLTIKDRHKEQLETDMILHLETEIHVEDLFPPGFCHNSTRSIGPGIVIFEMKQTIGLQALEEAVRQVQRRAELRRACGTAVGGLVVVTSQEDATVRTMTRLNELAAGVAGAEDVTFVCRRFNVQQYMHDIMSDRRDLAQSNAVLKKELQRQREQFRETERQQREEFRITEERLQAELTENDYLHDEILKCQKQVRSEYGEKHAVIQDKLSDMEMRLREEFKEQEERLRSDILYLERRSQTALADLEAKQREVSELEELHRKSKCDLEAKHTELTRLISQFDAERSLKEALLADAVAAKAESAARMEEVRLKFAEDRVMYADHMKLLSGGGFGIKDHAEKRDRDSAASEVAGEGSQAEMDGSRGPGSAAARLANIVERISQQSFKGALVLAKQNMAQMQEQLSFWCQCDCDEEKFNQASDILGICVSLMVIPDYELGSSIGQLDTLLAAVAVEIGRLFLHVLNFYVLCTMYAEQGSRCVDHLLTMYSMLCGRGLCRRVNHEKVGQVLRLVAAAIMKQSVDSSHPYAWQVQCDRHQAARLYLDVCLLDIQHLIKDSRDCIIKQVLAILSQTREYVEECLQQPLETSFSNYMLLWRERERGRFDTGLPADLADQPIEDSLIQGFIDFVFAEVDVLLHFNKKPTATRKLGTLVDFLDLWAACVTYQRFSAQDNAESLRENRYYEIVVRFERCGELDKASCILTRTRQGSRVRPQRCYPGVPLLAYEDGLAVQRASRHHARLMMNARV